jgi:FKBP-type peptidyl-prolyl cis-trans isomerase
VETGFSEQQVKNQFVKANQLVVAKENDEMDYYQKSHKMPFIKTKAGVRFFVYKPSVKGDSIKNDDVIKIKYKISLLDGTECYSSEIDGPKEFVVGMENIETGVHKAVLFLKSGDKALILIPSHLAHGLMGDSKKIPPQSPIIYDVEILSVKKAAYNG